MTILPDKGLYAITECVNLDQEKLLAKTEIILSKGTALLQYRNKDSSGKQYIEIAESLQLICKKYTVPFLINDDVDLAVQLGADGIHIGQDDVDCRIARIKLGPDKIIGVSCYNNLEYAVQAEQAGASYVAFGAFYSTNTKANTFPAEPDILSSSKKLLKLPVAAIGGITPSNGKILVNMGADFLAVASGLYLADNIEKTVQDYLELFDD